MRPRYRQTAFRLAESRVTGHTTLFCMHRRRAPCSLYVVLYRAQPMLLAANEYFTHVDLIPVFDELNRRKWTPFWESRSVQIGDVTW